MPAAKLPLSKQIAYACGMVGWSIMTNLIIVMLPYFYIPPSNAGLMPLVPQLLLFGVVNILSVIAASGRFIDALFDPLIASLSDESKNPQGRRIPFMKWAILPAIVFCCLTFYPPEMKQSGTNAGWLAVTMTLFFMCVTAYVIPYNALLPELTETAEEKVKLSSFQQAGFVLGIIIAASVNNYADAVEHVFHITNRDQSVQYAIWGLAALAGIAMLIPVLAIHEKKYSISKPSHMPLFTALRKTFSNANFKYYLISDFSFYMSLSVISSGMLYFVTVLLKLPESIGGALMGAMVVLSLVFYPIINYLSRRIGKKPLVLSAFGLQSIVFIAMYFLGKFPVSPYLQAYALVLCTSFPLAALGILPNAILAEIAQHESEETGENREGMFFAVKYLFVKMGQTLGIAAFAFLTVYGKDPGNDQGLRLSCLCGFILCFTALVFFSRFRERKS
jgi:GPH family glycoside/pentoside/hexuronide:cation symporter